jgi:hypothetical protein
MNYGIFIFTAISFILKDNGHTLYYVVLNEKMHQPTNNTNYTNNSKIISLF